MKKAVTPSILLIGITAIIVQIILLRELIIIFYGNEMSVGFILASWLLLGSIGSLILGRYADKIKKGVELFAICQIFLSISLPLSLILIRFIKKAIGITPGEIIGFGAMISSSFIILTPIAITLGFLFALSCRVYNLKDSAAQIAWVYILEAIGSILGGIACSFFLIKYFSSMEILVGLAILNVLACLYISNEIFRSSFRKLIKGAALLWLVALFIFVATGMFQLLDTKSLELAWRPLRLISSQNSIYGNIAVTKTDKQISFFSNGLHNFTVPDKLSQEEAVHFSMLQHQQPKEILLIGGGIGGLVSEILKYPINYIDYVELDPLIVEMGDKYLSETKYAIKENSKVNVINIDGRLWIKKADRKYDVIIINIPNPFTAQLNRFYTLEFFQELKRAMKSKGVASFSVTASENYISTDLGKFLGSINNTLKTVFNDVKVIPGDSAFFLISNKKDVLNLDYNFLANRLKGSGVNTKFVRKYYLFSKLSDDRIHYINETLKKNKTCQKNYDFRPISYYYDMVLWSSQFNSFLKKIFNSLTELRIWLAFVLIYIAIIMSYPIIKKRLKGKNRSVIIAIGTTGFSEIVFEITVLLAFQIIYGFMYYKIALILTSFMIGLALGSFYITKRLNKLKDAFGTFLKIQIGIVIYPLILPPIFLYLAGQSTGNTWWFGSNIIFPILPMIAGLIGGLQFPLGTKIYLGSDKNLARVGGMVYGIDLIGACVGAIIISGFLIPMLGIFKTCVAVSLLNLSVLVLLWKVHSDVLDKGQERCYTC